MPTIQHTAYWFLVGSTILDGTVRFIRAMRTSVVKTKVGYDINIDFDPESTYINIDFEFPEPYNSAIQKYINLVESRVIKMMVLISLIPRLTAYLTYIKYFRAKNGIQLRTLSPLVGGLAIIRYDPETNTALIPYANQLGLAVSITMYIPIIDALHDLNAHMMISSQMLTVTEYNRFSFEAGQIDYLIENEVFEGSNGYSIKMHDDLSTPIAFSASTLTMTLNRVVQGSIIGLDNTVQVEHIPGIAMMINEFKSFYWSQAHDPELYCRLCIEVSEFQFQAPVKCKSGLLIIRAGNTAYDYLTQTLYVTTGHNILEITPSSKMNMFAIMTGLWEVLFCSNPPDSNPSPKRVLKYDKS